MIPTTLTLTQTLSLTLKLRLPLTLMLPHAHAQAVVDVKRVKALIAQHTQRVTETRTNEFLSAASRGDEEKLKKVRWCLLGDIVSVRM